MMGTEQHFGYDDFVRFNRANPAVFRELKRLALQLVAKKKTKASIWQLANVLRWNVEFKVEGDYEYKLPNGTLGYYARTLMAAGVVPMGFFDTRPLLQEPSWWLAIDKVAA